ncbi:MAG TPA: hypothetical protein VF824_02690 [Thermoanaerobaculia bacterium]|jgi:hypothetical protein
MQKRVAAALAALLCCACASLHQERANELAQVAKDWCLTIRASQVLPVYPLTEDLQVGDLFLVATPLQEEVKELQANGFLPLDNVIGRLHPLGWSDYYNGAYQVSPESVLPRQWQFPEPPRTTTPSTDWSAAPGAAFPSYAFQVKDGKGATLALPVQSVPVGLSILATSDAYGTINISSASTYGLPVANLAPQVDEWAAQNRDFLKQYAPHMVARKHDEKVLEQNYVRTVYRVYVAGGVNVSLIENRSRGGRVDAGASKAPALFDAGSSTDAADAAKDYSAMLSSLSQSVAAATPGANITIASASSRSVAMNETFPRPLVVGYLAFDRPILDGGVLGAPIPTYARVSRRPISEGVAVFGADANTTKLRAWIGADPANRRKLDDWLNGRASIAVFLNGDDYRQLRADAVAQLGVK